MNSGANKQNYDKLPGYNDWIDQQYQEDSDELDILGFKPRPSFVMHQLSFDTYEALLADYQQQREEELTERVFRAFPAPIAHYFYRFLHGWENEFQRLQFLRDTCEA